MRPRRICIYYSNTGGGHKSAAGAVAAGIRSVLARDSSFEGKVTIRQRSIAEKTHPINNCLVKFYNYLARHHTTWIKYFYKLIHMMQPDSEIFYGLYRPYLHRLLKDDRPDLIVLAHPMLPHCITFALEELQLESQVKLAVVITDPNQNLWRGWATKRADLIVAPNELVRDRLLSWDVPAEKIRVLGMPVHPKFVAPPSMSRTRFLKKLGLTPERLTICINASWAGNTHWLKTYRALTECKRPLQVIFLCGHNAKLQEQVKTAAAETGIPTAILEFNNKIPELMNAVDLMVTKAGGLTTYEALARRLPLVLDNTIEPMPQEAPTMRMMVESGMAEELNRAEDIVGIVDSMDFPARRQAALPQLYQLDLTDSAIFEIGRSLLRLSNMEAEPITSLRDAA